MTTKNKTKVNLPAIIEDQKSFAIQLNTAGVELDDEILGMLDEEDYSMYEESRDTLDFVSIRQKDLKDEKGKTIYTAGGFKISSKSNPDIPDVDGDTGLVLTVIADQLSRIYWKDLNEAKPSCKSNDGIMGIGNPGGSCAKCPLGQWKADGEKPPCAERFNLLAYDHCAKWMYVLTLGRSALRPWNDFKSYLKKQKIKVGGVDRSIPMHFMSFKITTEYKDEPAPHYVPKFELISPLDKELISMMKSHRVDFKNHFDKTIDEVNETNDDINGNGNNGNDELDKNNELPPGVVSVEHLDDNENGEPEDPPFI